jgi:signal transduction histidine kinase
VSHEIILKHHGIIHVHSRAAKGTVFQIFLPDNEEFGTSAAEERTAATEA